MLIDSVILDGFKSFSDRAQVPLGDLTLLAGANSSGKSSVMQPLLLMKQTLESGYDPGPLLISGPNVVFSNTEQMFWAAPGDRKEQMTLGLILRNGESPLGYEVILQRQKAGATPPLQIVRAIVYTGAQREEISATLSAEQRLSYEAEVQQIVQKRLPPPLDQKAALEFEVQRERFFLDVNAKLLDPERGEMMGSVAIRFSQKYYLIEMALRGIIHVPGLRGNPRRTYPVTAVERNFPGLFPEYTASVIAAWQGNSPEKTEQLKEDLKELGLTWNVRARKISDTEVEIQVARLPKAIKHGARDLVSIADVGFGLSQSLPVAVALLAAEPGELVYLEQPEIHLHPRAEYKLSHLIQRAVARGVQVVVETHSELLLLGLQELVAKRQFVGKQVILHWVQRDRRGASYLTSKELGEKGDFGDVPVDFGAVSLEAMHNYLDAAAGD